MRRPERAPGAGRERAEHGTSGGAWSEHDPRALLERLRVAAEAAINNGKLRIDESRRLLDHLESSLRQTTYLQD